MSRELEPLHYISFSPQYSFSLIKFSFYPIRNKYQHEIQLFQAAIFHALGELTVH